MTTNTAYKQQQTAIIYARVSSEEQVQGFAIQAQRQAPAVVTFTFVIRWRNEPGQTTARLNTHRKDIKMKKTKQEQIAVIYVRARGAYRAQEDQTIQAQIRACHQWAESHGYTIAKTYIDRGKGASRNLQEREGLYHLLRDTIHKRAFNVILVQKFDRLFRSAFEFVILRTILEREHVQLIRVTEPMTGSLSTENLDMDRLRVVAVAEFGARNVSRESEGTQRKIAG